MQILLAFESCCQHPEVCQDLCPLDVNLLDIRFTNKLDRFVSSYRDPLAEAVAAL